MFSLLLLEAIMRVPFDSIFEMLPDGRVTPLVRVKLGPATMPANSCKIPVDGAAFGGIKIRQLIGKDLEVDVENGVHIIKGCYN